MNGNRNFDSTLAFPIPVVAFDYCTSANWECVTFDVFMRLSQAVPSFHECKMTLLIVGILRTGK